MKSCSKFLVILLLLAWVPASEASGGGKKDKNHISQASEVACYGVKPHQYTIYVGSDKEFHYFKWRNWLASGDWKVARYNVELPGAFALGKGKAFVKHNKNADLELFKPSRK